MKVNLYTHTHAKKTHHYYCDRLCFVRNVMQIAKQMFKNAMTSNTTPAQKEILLGYMRKYTSMATNSQAESSGRDQCNKRWEALTTKLNANGPPIKNCKAWKKTWADYKHRTKQKLALNKNSIQKTGGGPFKKIELTSFEEAVVELAKINAAVCGIHGIKTFSGDIQPQPSQLSTSQQPMSQPSTSQPSTIQPYTRHSLSDSEDSVENLVRDLVSSETDDTVPASVYVPSFVLADQIQNTQPSSTKRMMDKLELFKNSASSSEAYHKKVIDILTEIRDIKREQLEVLKKQAVDNAVHQKRKLLIREQELKVGIRTNELKEYKLGLRNQYYFFSVIITKT